MQILQAMRKERGDKKRLMGEITANLRGLDAKSEAELDGKIKDMEHKMTHEGVPIAEERKMVQLIAKLNQQRERVSCSAADAPAIITQVACLCPEATEHLVLHSDQLQQQASKHPAVAPPGPVLTPPAAVPPGLACPAHAAC